MNMSRVILALEPSPGELGEELSARGVEVARLYSPDEVVDVLDRGAFDLCVIFAVDPRMQEVLQQLRASPAGAVMPVLLVGGAETTVTSRDRALDLGADAFVDSGEGEDEVLARVEMLSGRPSAEPSAPTAAVDPVEEALAAAEAVAPAARDSDASDEPAKVAVGESSMQQIIDRVEARISAAPPADAGTRESAAEADPLAALDIEADLGRPARTDSEPPIATRAEKAAATATPEPVEPESTTEDDDDVEETLISPPPQEDEPTLPGTPARVAEAAQRYDQIEEDAGDESDDEITLTDAPVEPPLGELDLDEEAEAVSATPAPATVAASPAAEPPVSEAPAESAAPASAEGFDGGTLDQEPLWSLLARALADRVSGAFALVSRGVERKIFLDDGEPVMAVSSAREDRLIELLYREGRLTEDQYQQAVMTIGASGRRAGVILMEKGLITPRELFPLVRHHYETLVFDSFTWREGEWRFDPDLRAVGERILLDVPAGALIVEGMRLRSTPAEIDALILPGAMPLRLEEGICSLEIIDLPPEELSLLEACDGSRTTHELAQSFGMSEVELRTLLAGLVVLGWVRPIGGEASGGRPQTAVFTPAAAASDLRVERARVADKLAQVEEGTYFSILEISPEASGYEVRKAYRRLRGQFATERFAVSELSDLQPDVEVIRFVLDEAYEVLRDPAVREAYRVAIGGG
jgi:CheY-like chemotaxis protein